MSLEVAPQLVGAAGTSRGGTLLHPGFRDFRLWWTQCNDTLMACFIALRLSAGQLEPLRSDKSLLSKLFPDVKEVGRFDVTPARALTKMGEAERSVALTAILLALSVYQDFLVSACRLLQRDGRVDANVDVGSCDSARLGDLLASVGINVEPTDVGLLDLIRRMSNRILHQAAKGTDKLDETWSALPERTRKAWLRLGRPPGLTAMVVLSWGLAMRWRHSLW